MDAADANDDGGLDLGDVIWVLNFLFAQGPGIPAPSGSCGKDPTADSLGCETSLCLPLPPPTEGFIAFPASGPAPLRVTFRFSDPVQENRILSWAWDLDNDGTVESADARPTWVYEAAGTYSVALTVRTDVGQVARFLQADAVRVRERIGTVIKDNVILLENEPRLSIVSLSDAELVLDEAAGAPTLAVGDVIVGTEGLGFARIITSIARDGSTLTLGTADAPLTAIFEQGDLSGVVELTPEDLGKAGFVGSKGGGRRLPLDNEEIDAGVFLSGGIEFEPRLELDCRLEPAYLRCVFVGTLTLDLQARVGIEGTYHFTKEMSLLPKKLTHVDWVQVGWLPVIVYTEFDIKGGLDIAVEGSASVSAGYSSATTVRFGAEYRDGAIRPIAGLSLDARRFGPEFTFEAGGYAKIFVRPEGKLRIYGLLGPGAGVEPYLREEFSWIPAPEFALKAGIEAVLSFSLVDLKPFGFDFNAGLQGRVEGPVIVLGRWPLRAPARRPATPAFTASPPTGPAPLTVQFTDRSDPGDGVITGWSWALGDGETSTLQNPVHTYTKAGVYSASLMVRGTSGSADWAATQLISVTAPKVGPTARFSASPTRGRPPLTVRFTDSSTPGTAPITESRWDFNGDSVIDSFERNPWFVYTMPGLYDVSLMVPSAQGSDIETRFGMIEVRSAAEPRPGDCITITLPGGWPLKMIWCPPGTFLMGRKPGEQDSYDDEDPQHQVTLTRGFWLGKYEVTKRQWQAVMGTAPWAGLDCVLDHPDSPAVHVSWDDAQTFVARMNNLGQGVFRLPTEAEWEYACRAGTTTRFYWGDDSSYTEIGFHAWYTVNTSDVGERYAHVVGLKLPNAWGLYDMSGNVWEWCQDWWAERYPGGAATDPIGPASGFARVVRGGSWSHDGRHCRSASRHGYFTTSRRSYFGFRLARQ